MLAFSFWHDRAIARRAARTSQGGLIDPGGATRRPLSCQATIAPGPGESPVEKRMLTLTKVLSSTLLTLALSAVAAVTASAQEFKAGQIVVTQPWSRATPAGAKVAGGYMTITNKGTEPDRLIGGSLSAAGKAELHEMKMEGGVMRMRPLPNGLEIKPGQTVKLEPSGNHIMFEDHVDADGP